MEKNKFHLVSFLRNNFIAGMTLLLPLWGVYWFVRFVVTKLNDILLVPMLGLLQPYMGYVDTGCRRRGLLPQRPEKRHHLHQGDGE